MDIKSVPGQAMLAVKCNRAEINRFPLDKTYWSPLLHQQIDFHPLLGKALSKNLNSLSADAQSLQPW